METYLKVENIKLWARVGVLEEERKLGQIFNLDLFIWTNFEECTKNDDIKTTIDYAKLIEILKYESKKINCFTIEKYSDEILNIINEKFRLSRIKVILTKCKPPIVGFEGSVSIVRDYKIINK